MSKIDGVESCTNHSCVFGHPGGLGTNGQCHCLDIRPPDARIRATRNVLALRARIAEIEAELAAALVDAERYRELRRLATTWPTTALVVNYNIGHDWRTADVPDEIDRVVDAAIAARGAA